MQATTCMFSVEKYIKRRRKKRKMFLEFYCGTVIVYFITHRNKYAVNSVGNKRKNLAILHEVIHVYFNEINMLFLHI